MFFPEIEVVSYFIFLEITFKGISKKTLKLSETMGFNFFKEDDLYILNYMLINNISFIDSNHQTDEINIPEPLEDTLNVNQINTLLNWDRYAYRLKFNKH